MRVVSFLPSATEIVCTVGGRALLVGRSAECDFPADVQPLPVVMRPRSMDAERPSAEIDARVARARQAGESLYTIDVPALARLRPDVLLTQDLCGVCSVTDREVSTACREAGVDPVILSESPTRLEEVWSNVAHIGDAIGLVAEARQLARRLRERSAPRELRPAASRTVVVEWLDPPILSGLWTPDMVSAAGGLPCGPSAGAPGVRTSWDEIRSMDPDLVLVSPCSFHVERTRKEARAPRVSAGLASLRPQHGIWYVDEAYFSRPGPRLADGIDLVRSLLSGEDPASGASAERRLQANPPVVR